MNTIIEKIRAEVERLKKDVDNTPLATEQIAGYLFALVDVQKRLSDLEKEEKPTNPTIREQPVKTDIVEDLKHYLATTPKEQIKKDWESLKEWGKVGPSVSEFLGWKQPVCEGLEEEAESCWRIVFPDGGIETTKMALTHDEFMLCARHFAKWGAEHRGSSEIPKDLESYAQMVENYYDVGEERGYLCVHRGEVKDAVIAGAKWQAEQDQETIELAEDHAYLAGAVNEREKIMNKAVEGHISTNGMGNKYLFPNYNDDFKDVNDGDKVLIIIVKEEGKCTE